VRRAAGETIVWLGTYESDYPRNRVLIDGARLAGAAVRECHEPVWERYPHKAGGLLGPAGALRVGARMALAWARLARRAAGLPPARALVVGYPAQPDAPPAWVVARLRRRPLVVDMMISLSDTLAGDRARVGRLGGALALAADRLALAAADLVIADTRANADWMIARFGVAPAKLVVVPVGADPRRFRPSPQPEGPAPAMFYGKLAPMHGLETILEAARAPGAPALRLIGDGQLGPWLRRELRRRPIPGLEHVPWVPYERLGEEIARAGICLGIFGAGAKAGRVVPNKVWQAMAVGRPIVTADTPGAREVLRDGVDALLVPPGDAPALAGALRELAADDALRARLGTAARARYEEVADPRALGERLIAAIDRIAA
jgi:glycosyltransferase involved in cell wall biosynthesis